MTTAVTIRQPRGGAFAALTSRSYRIYLGGQALANTGSWMQAIAQDWLIFSLTHDSTAVGVTMALQFLPTLLLGLHTGAVADRFPKRLILLVTQSLNAIATAALALTTLAGVVRPADVYAFALLAGVIFAFDAPARQSFVTEVVSPSRLRAAISLNAAVFQATRLIGPAIASLLIVKVGTGWVFALNAACYLGPTAGLLLLRPSDLDTPPASPRGPGAVRAAARYVRGRPDVLWTIFLVGVVGTFGLNFPIVLTAMAKSAFGGSASTYGLFNIVLAVGSSAGALLAGAGRRPRQRVIVAAAAGFGLLQVAAALMPGMAAFLSLIAAMGFVNLVFQAMANASVQLAVDPRLRGRVMGLYMLVFMGGTPIGAPIIGMITSHFGARVGMATCGAVPALAAVITAAAVMTGTGASPRGAPPGGHPHWVNLMARRCAKLATMAIGTRLSAGSARRPEGGRRFGLLLAVLVGTYLLSAFVPGTVIKVLQITLFLAVVMIAVRASHLTPRITRLVNALVLAGSAAAFALQATSDTPSSPAAGVASAWAALVLLFAVILILRDVLTGKAVTLQSIFGALSAYLIIGLMFAASYAAMSKFNGGSFFANGQPGTTATFQYFSFTTLTTVGYGDFTAAVAGGRAVAVMEAVLGQVFLAVLVGWLVSVFRAPRFSGDSGDAGDSAGTAPHALEPTRRNRAAMRVAVRRSTRDRSARPRPGAPARLTRRG